MVKAFILFPLLEDYKILDDRTILICFSLAMELDKFREGLILLLEKCQLLLKEQPFKTNMEHIFLSFSSLSFRRAKKSFIFK